MAINLPTLIQRVRVDTSGLAKGEQAAKSFAQTMRQFGKDLDAETVRLQGDTDDLAESTEKSNKEHKETPKAVKPATDALKDHAKATRDSTKATNETTRATTRNSRATRRSRTDHDSLSRSVRATGRAMRLAKKDIRSVDAILGRVGGAIGGIASLFFKLDAAASLVGPVLTTVSSLGAAAVGAAGGLGQIASALGAVSVAAVGSLSQMSGVVAALPGLLGAAATGFVAMKASFKGVGDYYKAVAKYGKDSDQAKEKFKALAPEVRTLTKTLDVYKAAIADMGDITRQIATPGFTKALKSATPVLAVLKDGTKDLAKEVSIFAQGLGKFVGSKGFLADLRKLAGNNTKVFAAMSAGVRPLAGAFTNIAVAAAPMTLLLAKASTQFAKFLEVKTSKRGSLTDFFTRAGEQVIVLAHGMGSLMGALVGIGGIGAKVFFGKKGLVGGIDETMTRFNKWTNSKGGIAKITGYFERMKPIVEHTFSAVWNFTKGLKDLFTIGNTVFFGKDGMIGGIDTAAKKFSDWTSSPNGIAKITGYFEEMKPVASEVWALLKDVGTNLFNLGRDKNTATLLRQIRTDLLPSIVTVIEKAKELGPSIVTALAGIGEFIAGRDVTALISVAGSLADIAAAAGSLMTSSPVFSQMTSFLLTAMLAKKVLGAKMLIGLLPFGLGAAAPVVAPAVGAAGAATAGVVAAGAGGVAAAEVGAAGAATVGVAAKAAGLLKGAAVKGLRAGIFAMIGYAIGNAIVDIGIKPTAEKGVTGAQTALDAKATWEASKKTVADSETYQKSLKDAAAGITASRDGLAGGLLYGVNIVSTGMKNWFTGENNGNLSDAQHAAIAAIDAETARVIEQTRLNAIEFAATPAGVKAAAAAKAAAETPEARRAATVATTATDKKNATDQYDREQAQRDKNDRKKVTDWENGKRPWQPGKSSPFPTSRMPADVQAAADRVKALDDKAKAEAERKRIAGLQAAIPKAAAEVKNKEALAAQSKTALEAKGGPGNIRGGQSRAEAKLYADDVENLRLAREALVAANAALKATLPPLATAPAALPPMSTQALKNIRQFADDTPTAIGTALDKVPALGTSAADRLTAALSTGFASIPALTATALGPPSVNGTAWYDSGYSLTTQFAAGITDGTGPVLFAMTHLTTGLADKVPGSPVKTGPLRKFNDGKTGLVLAQMFAGGLTKGVPHVAKAATGLASTVARTTMPTASGAAIASPFTPAPARATAPTSAPGPRPVVFQIGTVQDGDTLLRRARANDRMLSLAEGGDSNQMAGIGI
ncbi:MAG: hypothetical protein ACOH10_10395 [Rhodoglobus sp.]